MTLCATEFFRRRLESFWSNLPGDFAEITPESGNPRRRLHSGEADAVGPFALQFAVDHSTVFGDSVALHDAT
jgi:hypothetical protein